MLRLRRASFHKFTVWTNLIWYLRTAGSIRIKNIIILNRWKLVCFILMLLESSIYHNSAWVKGFRCSQLKCLCIIWIVIAIVLLTLKSFNFHDSVVICKISCVIFSTVGNSLNDRWLLSYIPARKRCLTRLCNALVLHKLAWSTIWLISYVKWLCNKLIPLSSIVGILRLNR